MTVTQATISNTLARSVELLKDDAENSGICTRHAVQYPNVEKALVKWIK